MGDELLQGTALDPGSTPGSSTTYYRAEPKAPWHRVDPGFSGMALCGALLAGGPRAIDAVQIEPGVYRCQACFGK